MSLFSLETATYGGGVGRLDEDGTFRGKGPFASRSASREILPAFEALLEGRWEHLEALAVSTGPGLFTGVRVGLALAKTLAWTREVPLVAVPTLDAVAWQHGRGVQAQPGEALLALNDARRGEVYGALFEWQEGPEGLQPKRRGNDLALRPEAVKERFFSGSNKALAEGPLWLAGDGAIRYKERWPEFFGKAGHLVEEATMTLPQAVAERGKQLWKAGRLEDPLRLVPHYVRRPDARPPAAVF